VLGEPVPDAPREAPRASGRLDSHYAPRTPLHLVAADALAATLAALAGQRVALLAPAALLPPAGGVPAQVAPESPGEYARALYGLLHRLDAVAADRIVVVAPPAGADWEGVHDRLRRAAVPLPTAR
jgi:L-threonylcarbamoyladenylate synthase